MATAMETPQTSSEPKRLCERVKHESRKLDLPSAPLSVYGVPLQEKHLNMKGCQHFIFGNHSTKANFTIMVLGATGSGKSTLINGMINYILDVKWDDSFRFKLVNEDQTTSQAHSQTSEVIVYKINHQDGFTVPFSLTIVDTPGFGDTRGIGRDKKTVEQIRTLFSSAHGVQEIDAICFVAQASLTRLTSTQKYIFDSVLSIFGKDVAENIRILVTFADGQRPAVLDAIKESGVPCPKDKKDVPRHFKFNNAALFVNNGSSASNTAKGHDDDDDDDDDDDESKDGAFDKICWDMGTNTMKNFFAALSLMKTKSLTLTKEVLEKRKIAELSVENIQKQVRVSLAKQEEIKETHDKIKDNEAEINRNKHFEFEVTVEELYREDISGTGNRSTNCEKCKFTCQYPSSNLFIVGIVGLWDVITNKHCTQCPGKCYSAGHYICNYRWSHKKVKEKRVVKDMLEKFQKANEEKLTVQGLMDRLNDEFEEEQRKGVALIQEAAECLNRLKKIALNPNPLSTPEYIDLMIEREKIDAKSGYKQRINALESMKETAEMMAKVEKKEHIL